MVIRPAFRIEEAAFRRRNGPPAQYALVHFWELQLLFAMAWVRSVLGNRSRWELLP
jgi:hypothetical protein